MTKSSALREDKLVCHFAISDGGNHRVQNLKLVAREEYDVPWEAVYRRLLRQKDILSQSQMGQNNTGSGTNRNRASTYTLKMYNYETENKLYRANIRGPSFKKIEDEKYKIVKSMYKRKNPKCSEQELESIVVEYKNTERGQVLAELDNAYNMNESIWIRMHDVNPREIVSKANGKKFRSILTGTNVNNIPDLPYRYYKCRILALKKAKGLLDIRFETLGEIEYAGQYGEDRIEESNKKQSGKGTASHEDNYADDESDLNIFDVIRAQDVYMQSKTKPQHQTLVRRGNDLGKFQFPFGE